MYHIFKIIFSLLMMQFCFGQNFIEDQRFGSNEAGSEAGQFNSPQAIAVSQNKIVYVVDTGNNCIQLFDLSGNFIKSIGGFGFTSDKFDRPTDIWVQSLINIYVADYNNKRIQRYDGSMNYLSTLTSNDGLDVQFQFYETLSCVVNSQQDLFVLDAGDNKVIKFNRNGQAERSFGDYESGDGQLIQPIQMDIVSQKYIVVSDIDLKAIMIYDFFGNFLKKIISDQWIAPSGIAVTDQDEILIADPLAKKIFIIQSNFASIKEIETALQRPFRKPQDIACFSHKAAGDKTKKFYVVDNNNIIIGNFINP
jgi:tripartite motif-containing protein 71